MGFIIIRKNCRLINSKIIHTLLRNDNNGLVLLLVEKCEATSLNAALESLDNNYG